MATPMHKLRISDSDWKKINELAVSAGMSASAWLLQAAKEKAAPYGVTIEGAAPEGNPNIATLNKRRNDVPETECPHCRSTDLWRQREWIEQNNRYLAEYYCKTCGVIFNSDDIAAW